MVLRLRSFCLSLAVAACFALFLGSHTAYALIDEGDFLEPAEVEICHSTHYTDLGDSYSKGTIGTTGWLAGTTIDYLKYDRMSYSTYPSVYFIDRFQMRNQTESLFPIGTDYTLTISGLTNWVKWAQASNTSYNGNLYFYGNIERFRVYVYDPNGDYVELTDANVTVSSNSSTGVYYMTVSTGELPFDVHQIDVDIIWRYGGGYWEDTDSEYMSGNWLYTRCLGFSHFNVSWIGYNPSVGDTAELVDVSKGILETVIGIATSIGELPSSIWSSFENGLTNLFVPGEESISNMQQQWNDLLADRFGALYQVIDLISDYAEAFTESEQTTITIPELNVPVGGDGWTFGGWEVQVVPDGMEVLFTTLKTIVSIAATFLFVNGLKRRFEGLIGGAPTA